MTTQNTQNKIIQDNTESNLGIHTILVLSFFCLFVFGLSISIDWFFGANSLKIDLRIIWNLVIFTLPIIAIFIFGNWLIENIFKQGHSIELLKKLKKIFNKFARLIVAILLLAMPIIIGILTDNAMRLFDYYTFYGDFEEAAKAFPTTALKSVFLFGFLFSAASSIIIAYKESFIKSYANVMTNSPKRPFDIIVLALSPPNFDKDPESTKENPSYEKAFKNFRSKINGFANQNMALKNRLEKLGQNFKLGVIDDEELGKLISPNRPETDTQIVFQYRTELGRVWQQPLRVIYNFLSLGAGEFAAQPIENQHGLREIIVLCTGTTSEFSGYFAKYLKDILKIPHCDIRIASGLLVEGNYNDTLELIEEEIQISLGRLLESNPKLDPRVCIDITSGIKEFSAAGAILTLNRDYYFCYMNNQSNDANPFDILFYDAQISGTQLGV